MYPLGQNSKKLQKQHVVLCGHRRCLRAPSEDTSSDRKGHIVDVETFMSVEAHAMLLHEIGMYSSQSVDKAFSWGIAAEKHSNAKTCSAVKRLP